MTMKKKESTLVNMVVVLFVITLVAGLTLGYVIQNLDRKEIISLPIPIVSLRKALQKMGLLFFMPISFLCAD